MTQTRDDHLSTQQAAAELGLTTVTIRAAFRKGQLEGYRDGEQPPGHSHLRITRESIDRYRLLHKGRPGRRRKT